MIKFDFFLILEPFIFVGDGEYNINDLREIKVTKSYLGLDQDLRGCQYEESNEKCRTREHLKTLMDTCGCIPLSLRLTNKVRCPSFSKYIPQHPQPLF